MSCVIAKLKPFEAIEQIKAAALYCPHSWIITDGESVEVQVYGCVDAPCPTPLHANNSCGRSAEWRLRVFVVATRQLRSFQHHDDIIIEIQFRSLDDHLLKFSEKTGPTDKVSLPDIKIPPKFLDLGLEEKPSPVSRVLDLIIIDRDKTEELPARIEVSIHASTKGSRRPLVSTSRERSIFVDPLVRTSPSDVQLTQSAGDKQLMDWLIGATRQRVEEGKVVGDYYRFEQSAKAAIRELIDKVTSFLGAATGARRNLLVWGPSGIGKTFLFSQIHSSLPADLGAQYVSINAASATQNEVSDKLEYFRQCQSPVLCLLDEVDSPNHRGWFCSQVFSRLDDNVNGAPAQRVYVVAGSNLGGLTGMKAAIASAEYPRGDDLLNRISPEEMNHYIPGLTNVEKAQLFGQQLLAARGNPAGGLEIDALALYYIGADRPKDPSPYGTIRSIMLLARDTAKRTEGQHVIRWIDESVADFYMDRRDIFRKLQGKTVHFE